MKDKDKKKQLEEKYVEFQLLEQQFKALQKQLIEVEEQLRNIDILIENLKDFKNIKKDSEILVAISNGIFARAKILDTKKLRVNVGANSVITKDVEEVIEMIKKQRESVKIFRDKLNKDIETILTRVEDVEKELNALLK